MKSVPPSAPESAPAPEPERAPEPVPIASAIPGTTNDTSAAPTTDALTLDGARARFRDIYEAAKGARTGIHGFLNSGCDIIAVDQRTITFGFEFGWIPEKFLPGTQAHRSLTGVVEQVLGRHFEVQCTHAPGVENRLRAMPTKPSHLADEARRLGLRPVERGPARP